MKLNCPTSSVHSETADAAAMLDGVIRSRRSVRAFRPDLVPKPQLMEILEIARAAPSNFNSLQTGRTQSKLWAEWHKARRRDFSRPCFPENAVWKQVGSIEG